ncbi:hypothetical protein [Paenibacillus daejeonensis]|uniref:hypothetical protein n=1 Tax=Paenibacillus daejeonensis TaxID=135193 RepID=UPI0003689113|nr:hypothetical protein [Paenibacillus daejeonensis]
MKRFVASAILFLSVLIIFIGLYFLVKFNDGELINLRIVQEGGEAYNPEIELTLSTSGHMNLYLIHSGTTLHSKLQISESALQEMKQLTRVIFWKYWFTYGGKEMLGDHEGYWRRELDLDGKTYNWYNYPYSDNELNKLVGRLLELSPRTIGLSENGNIVIEDAESLFP